MQALRLRNLTTGLLHTEIDHIYEDLEYITGIQYCMIHETPFVRKKITRWLLDHVPDKEYWDGKYNPDVTGDYPLEPMTDEEKKQVGFK